MQAAVIEALFLADFGYVRNSDEMFGVHWRTWFIKQSDFDIR